MAAAPKVIMRPIRREGFSSIVFHQGMEICIVSAEAKTTSRGCGGCGGTSSDSVSTAIGRLFLSWLFPFKSSTSMIDDDPRELAEGFLPGEMRWEDVRLTASERRDILFLFCRNPLPLWLLFSFCCGGRMGVVVVDGLVVILWGASESRWIEIGREIKVVHR
jgi:hypothetical protein